MNYSKTMTIPKSFLSILVLALLAACSAPTDKKAELESLKAEYNALGAKIKSLEKELGAGVPAVAEKGKSVVTESATVKPFQYFVETQGGVEAEENIMVSARSGGMVTNVFVKEGQQVQQGQVLAQIDNAITQKAIDELKGSLDLAKTVFERQKSLWDQKIGTEIQFLTAKNNKESLEKRLATLLEQDDLSRVRSAINGTVDQIMVKVGETIAPGMPAMRIVNTGRLKVKANVSEAHIRDIHSGLPATIELADLGLNFKGQVAFSGKNINPLSRTFAVEIPVPYNADVRPGMSARVRIDFKTLQAITVPVNLVQDLNGEKVIYVAEVDGKSFKARKRIVSVGGIYANQAEITSGIKAGDLVITVGYQGLNDGESITL